jgi:hypothetical protein
MREAIMASANHIGMDAPEIHGEEPDPLTAKHQKACEDQERAIQALEDVNERFALVTVGTEKKDRVVAEFTSGHERFIGYWDDAAFKRYFINHPKIVTLAAPDKFVTVAHRWLTEPNRAKQYSRLVCAPDGSTELPLEDEAYNLWRGFAVTPKSGDWSAIQDFILDIICADNPEHFDWLINWMAALVQKPGERAHSALVLTGGQGIGKGFFAEQVIGGLLHAEHWAHLTAPEHLTGNFNAHLKNRVLVFADEAVWESKAHANRLKALITERTFWSEQKYVAREQVENLMHLIVASNSDNPVLIERDDRRLLILQVDESRKSDTTYFGNLSRLLDGGGRAAMLENLLIHDVDWEALRHPPESDAKTDIKADSLAAPEQWWREVLTDAVPEKWKERQSRKTLLHEFQEWARENRARSNIDSSSALGSWFVKHFSRADLNDWPKRGRDIKVYSPNGRLNAWEFPDLELCRSVFKEATGVAIDAE